MDKSLEGRKNLVAGRQQAGLSLAQRGAGPRLYVDPERRYSQRERGRGLPEADGCGGKLVVGKAVEVGHIFKLGYKYSESMGARVLDANGKEVTPIMGSYGIGIERILTAAIEQSNDQNGFWLPASIAPFTVVVTVTNVPTRRCARQAKSWQRSLKQRGSMCCWMTETSAPASNSKTRTWWEFLPDQCGQEGCERAGGSW